MHLAFHAKTRRYIELQYKEAESFIENLGNVQKLIESRKDRFGCIEPSLELIDQLTVQRNIEKLRGQGEPVNNVKEDSRKVAQKLSEERSKLG